MLTGNVFHAEGMQSWCAVYAVIQRTHINVDADKDADAETTATSSSGTA